MSVSQLQALQKETITEQDRIELLDYCMEHYGHDIKRVVYSYVQNEVDAEDVTQEVFMSVYQKIDQFNQDSQLKSWLIRIAINKSKDHLRSFKHRQQRLKDKLLQSFKKESIETTTPEDLSIQTDENKQLIKQIYELPTKYKEVIILYYFEQFTVKEMADILKSNENTIKARLKRGRDRLKTIIESGGGDHG
ncbi:sigma-70 family RNA polymerase sigma factor [Alkalibacillus haloalkaliphilus]|uniref:RNA polymerase sigma factor n=1 Tax=Alkalibacillus haloalkaliphilus TaxID=94136 RepID=A0A511W4Q1_9BACI|nr:sigma-70 family RNA polymerase sigma factor [Alkalibacillus haloalkaliphilus]GEN46086.1 RNA polymerase subunit sigma [Alkalibacillus haloalkaliphilus]